VWVNADERQGTSCTNPTPSPSPQPQRAREGLLLASKTGLILESAPAEVGKDPNWILHVHGKNVFREIFSHFSDATYEYREVEYLPLLAMCQSQIDHEPLAKVSEKLIEMGAIPPSTQYARVLQQLVPGNMSIS
jgi:hypothetical protein